MGVERVQTLQQMPVEMMQSALGQSGVMIWERANGIDDSPVIPYSERKSISTECTFEEDTIDVDYLRRKLVSMSEELAFSLRKEQKLSACLTLKIRYSNFDTHTKQAMIPYTALDDHLIAKAKELFEKLYERRMLVRLIGLKVSHLVHGQQQINLFEDTQEKIRLYQAMDKINKRYGALTIRRSC
jgi:DNA polymerase-4